MFKRLLTPPANLTYCQIAKNFPVNHMFYVLVHSAPKQNKNLHGLARAKADRGAQSLGHRQFLLHLQRPSRKKEGGECLVLTFLDCHLMDISCGTIFQFNNLPFHQFFT